MDQLDQSEYYDHRFLNLKLEEATFSDIHFEDCDFEDCSFRETQFSRCVFQGCTFKNCDLSLVKVANSIFTNVAFASSKLIGINWSAASWKSMRYLHPPLNFDSCDISYSIFTGLTLEKIKIKRCLAKEVDFSEAKLKQTSFSGTDLTGSQFSRTDLTETDFRGARNYLIDLNVNEVKKARFSLPEAMSLLKPLDIIVDELDP